MCYAYKPVQGPDGSVFKVPLREFASLEKQGLILMKSDGYHYAKDTVAAIRNQGGSRVLSPLRWDLIPRGFLAGSPITVAEAIRKKNSRAINPVTGKSWGFTSFNARSETVERLPSFRLPWREGLRCLIPVSAYKERPNMEGAPPAFLGREYEVSLEGEFAFAGIYDRWESHTGEAIDSCTIITLSSAGNSKVEAIWHERIPALLNPEQGERWLDEKTTPKQALHLLRQPEADLLSVKDITAPGGADSKNQLPSPDEGEVLELPFDYP